MNAGRVMLWCWVLLGVIGGRADWPMVRGSAGHGGFTSERVAAPFRLAWAAEFENERIGTAVEPIVKDGRVFVATHAGSIFCLDAKTGEAIWRVAGSGAFLHSPAVFGKVVIAANAHGTVFWINAESGAIRRTFDGPMGGFSAAPIVADGAIYLGSRSGEMMAFTAEGELKWRVRFPAPIRETAAFHGGRVYVMAEDLRLRALDTAGRVLWTSDAVPGQTARDYYPVVVERDGKTFVAVRTNPLRTMSQRIGRDRTMLARNAGFDDSGWQKVDAWIKRPDWRGTPELWTKEQEAIVKYLEGEADAENLFVFDAAEGKRAAKAPILWASGCQAAGAPPALTADGRMLVFYRSAYGNWNHGVAPLVALGLYDPAANRIAPLFHQSGAQPPWNTFWGTADESQNFVVAGETVLIVHQGTLSGFDLKRNELFKIQGERDTFGGFHPPVWARNEWHGPARSGVAVSDGKIYWQTGSRILCLASGESGKAAEPKTIAVAELKTIGGPKAIYRGRAELREELNRVAAEILSERWAPLFVDPGLNGREFFFAESADYFAAFAAAYRFLNGENQVRASAFLRDQLEQHPPFTAAGRYSLREGRAREWFQVPDELRTGGVAPAHPFGGLAAAWEWATKCGGMDKVMAQWPAIKAAEQSFQSLKWTLDPKKGDPHANRYITSLQAFAAVARQAGEPAEAERVRKIAEVELLQLMVWWKNAAASVAPRSFKGSSELDRFIGGGDLISLRIAPHRHKVALFRDLTQDLFREILEEEPEAVGEVWSYFARIYKTWPLIGEERQVHFGENFVDTPELALDAHKIMGWQGENSWEEHSVAVDLPICRADVYYLHKLALALGN